MIIIMDNNYDYRSVQKLERLYRKYYGLNKTYLIIFC